MLKLVIPENGTEDDAMIEHDFSGLREYPAFVSAAKKFEVFGKLCRSPAHAAECLDGYLQSCSRRDNGGNAICL